MTDTVKPADRMRVLIACEFSGIVRDAFAALGHDAWSCDLLPSERPGNHIQGDVEELLDKDHALFFGRWDLMIAFPPCTYLANSGNKHLYIGKKKENGIDPRRWNHMVAAAKFFRQLLTAPIPRIAIENPIMSGHAKKIIGVSQSQIIQPWQFGHGETKATCLWLVNLPRLRPTNIVDGRRPRVHHASPSPDRWKERSRTLSGIADAMADQWGRPMTVKPADDPARRTPIRTPCPDSADPAKEQTPMTFEEHFAEWCALDDQRDSTRAGVDAHEELMCALVNAFPMIRAEIAALKARIGELELENAAQFAGGKELADGLRKMRELRDAAVKRAAEAEAALVQMTEKKNGWKAAANNHTFCPQSWQLVLDNKELRAQRDRLVEELKRVRHRDCACGPYVTKEYHTVECGRITELLSSVEEK